MPGEIPLRPEGIGLHTSGVTVDLPGCCCCADSESLCYSISVTDDLGNAYTITNAAIFWVGGTGYVSFGARPESPWFPYSLQISCGPCGIVVLAQAAVLIEGCDCTFASGETLLECIDGSYAQTKSFDVLFDDAFGFCAGCPAVILAVTVTVSEPPC